MTAHNVETERSRAVIDRPLEFRHFGLRFLNKSLSFSRNSRPAWMRQTFRTDSCAAASAYPARRGGVVAIFSILAVERNDAFGQARCSANKLRAPCCTQRLSNRSEEEPT